MNTMADRLKGEGKSKKGQQRKLILHRMARFGVKIVRYLPYYFVNLKAILILRSHYSLLFPTWFLPANKK
jgi:hypothetical protein